MLLVSSGKGLGSEHRLGGCDPGRPGTREGNRNGHEGNAEERKRGLHLPPWPSQAARIIYKYVKHS